MSLSPFMQGKFRHHLNRVFTVPFGLVVVLCAVFLGLIGSVVGTARQALKYDDAVTQAIRLEQLLIERQISLNGYLTTGEQRFLDRYQEAQKTLAPIFDDLARQVERQPGQAEQLAELRSRSDRWHSNAQRLLATRSASGSPISPLLSDDDRREIELIHEQAAALVANEVALHDQSGRLVVWAAILLVGGSLVGTLGLAIVWFVFAYRSLRAYNVRYEQAQADAEVQTAELAELYLQHERLEAQLIQSQKFESIGLLAGGIAHDFNNLLTTINGCVELAREALPADHSTQIDLTIIQDATNRANMLTHQLLTFASEQSVAAETFSLNELLRDLALLLQRALGADIELAIYPAPDLWLVNADRNRIEQVVLNLAINARDAMASNGKLVVETTNADLDSTYCVQHPGMTPGLYVVLSVSDNGKGIPNDIQSQIFEPFFTTKASGKGTGLGLSTSHDIVKQYGGKLQVYSEVGYGTTFKVYLPCVAPNSSIVHEMNALVQWANKTILLVEDQELVRIVATRLLCDRGYTVLSAATGKAGLQLAKTYEGTLDLLLVDMVLPDREGRRLAEEIASIRPGINILFVSGYPEHMLVDTGRLALEQRVLHKPFTAAELLMSVGAALELND